jgi:metal-dependent hydrolase (beta-lactamase superfamily II)
MRKRSKTAILVFPLLGLAGPSGGGTPLSAQEEMTLTVLFDNLWTDDRLQTGWGFAALLETPGHTVLFDTGTDGGTIRGIVEEFRNLGVEVAGPTHCSGLVAMTAFQDAYGKNFQRMGVGRVLTFPR